MLNHRPVIVNAAGHLAGAIIFGIFLALAFRGATRRQLRENRLSIASAGLAWLWNAASFATLVFPTGATHWVLDSASFSSLSLLPAVLLHLSLNGRFRIIATTGYLLSAVATGMHLCEHLRPALSLHKWALWVITAGFGGLTLSYAAMVLLRGGKETRGRASQIVASMGLLLFVVTFSHFEAGHPAQPWAKELLLHHVGIPVSLLILLQDYRFVFLDAFVRFLANVILAGLLGYAGVRLVSGLAFQGGSNPLGETPAVGIISALLILFAYLRGVVQRWLTMAVFRRGSMEGTVRELRSKATTTRNEAAYLEWAAERLAAAAGTPRFALIESADKRPPSGPPGKDPDYPSLVDVQPWVRNDPRWDWAEAVAPIRLSHGSRYLLLGGRKGGQRNLSEDLRSLNYLATVIAEEVERFRAAEMQRLVSEAELRALHSQINPHFLFNALNTIYGVIPREAVGARRTVLNLAEIFRYALQSDKILIPLSEELKIVKAYLDIERLRLGPRLQTMIEVAKEAEQTLIPILSVQPLVENAIKHGVAMRSDVGWLRLTAKLADGSLTIVVEDSGNGGVSNTPTARPAGAGVGLANVTRRLQLCFGLDAAVTLDQGDYGTKVQFSIPRRDSAIKSADPPGPPE